MIEFRPFTGADVPALQTAIDIDNIHPGQWKVAHFYDDPEDKKALRIPKEVSVLEDQHGPIAFVRYTKTLRISCVWVNTADNSRNAKAVIQGIRDAAAKAKASGFTEIIITTNYEKLANFFTQVMKMTRSGDEYLLSI